MSNSTQFISAFPISNQESQNMMSLEVPWEKSTPKSNYISQTKNMGYHWWPYLATVGREGKQNRARKRKVTTFSPRHNLLTSSSTHSEWQNFYPFLKIIFIFKYHINFSKIWKHGLGYTHLEVVSGPLPVPVWSWQKLQMVMDVPSQSSQIQNERWWC